MQLAPASLHELPSPIQPYGEQKGRFEARRRANQEAIVFLDQLDHHFEIVLFFFLPARAGGHNPPNSAQAANHCSTINRCSPLATGLSLKPVWIALPKLSPSRSALSRRCSSAAILRQYTSKSTRSTA